MKAVVLIILCSLWIYGCVPAIGVSASDVQDRHRRIKMTKIERDEEDNMLDSMNRHERYVYLKRERKKDMCKDGTIWWGYTKGGRGYNRYCKKYENEQKH